MKAEATIPTLSAKRYLGQFCKHFAHKLSVETDPANEHGKVIFGGGTCHLKADDERLLLTITADSDEDLAVVGAVVTRHLVRFAFRETLDVSWKIPA